MQHAHLTVVRPARARGVAVLVVRSPARRSTSTVSSWPWPHRGADRATRVAHPAPRCRAGWRVRPRSARAGPRSAAGSRCSRRRPSPCSRRRRMAPTQSTSPVLIPISQARRRSVDRPRGSISMRLLHLALRHATLRIVFVRDRDAEARDDLRRRRSCPSSPPNAFSATSRSNVVDEVLHLLGVGGAPRGL